MPFATLEEIRLLSNLETQQGKLLQIVLFGQPELDRNLDQPHIRQLKERITHSFFLKPLNAEEVREYLMFRLRIAGYHGPDLFGPAVVKAITRASLGLTRRVNILADKILLAAFADNTHTLTVAHARAAIADSDYAQARGPWRRAALVAGLVLAGAGAGAALHAISQAPRPPGTAAPAVPAPLTPAAVPAPRTPAAPPVAADSGDLVAQRLAATEAWLSRQPPATGSIQLMSSSDPRQLRGHLAKIGRVIEMDQVFVYRTKVQGQPAWTVLYGSFATRAEAAAALEKLPPTLRNYRPYLRTVQGIKAETGQLRLE